MAQKYGPAVVGQEVYEEREKIIRMTKDKYGPAILEHPKGKAKKAAKPAPEPPDEELEEVEDVDEEEGEDADEEEVEDAGAEPYVTIAEFEAALNNDPDKVVELLEHELARASGPRKGALRALRTVELGGYKRPDVLAMIEEKLA